MKQERNLSHYFQLIATGVAGDHMGHVQGHVVRAPGIVIGQKLGHIMVEIPAQDLQAPTNHATHIAAHVSKMDGNGHVAIVFQSYILIAYRQSTIDISRLFLIIVQAIEPCVSIT